MILLYRWFTDETSTPPAASSAHATYDFEQTVLHELCHGLGFISSWYPWINSDSLLPSYPITDSNGVYLGLGQPYIFNKWLLDDINQIWYYQYADQIMSDAASLTTNDYTAWLNNFEATNGYGIAVSLMNNITITNMRTLYMYPLLQSSLYQDSISTNSSNTMPDYGFAVLYTPTNFSLGSSISHMDADFYDGSSEFLMRPFGTPYTALDDYSPMGALGPVE